MAGSKQGKTGASAKGATKKMLGQKVLLLSMGDPFVCPICGRSQKRGMVSNYEGKSYCSENCVQKVANVG